MVHTQVLAWLIIRHKTWMREEKIKKGKKTFNPLPSSDQRPSPKPHCGALRAPFCPLSSRALRGNLVHHGNSVPQRWVWPTVTSWVSCHALRCQLLTKTKKSYFTQVYTTAPSLWPISEHLHTSFYTFRDSFTTLLATGTFSCWFSTWSTQKFRLHDIGPGLGWGQWGYVMHTELDPDFT